MTADELKAAGHLLYGGHGWMTRMAEDLKVDPSTVRRWVAEAVPIPGPVEVALKCMVASQPEAES